MTEKKFGEEKKLSESLSRKIKKIFNSFNSVLAIESKVIIDKKYEKIELTINDKIIITDSIVVTVTRGGKAPKSVERDARKRYVARLAKNWKKADKYRDELDEKGWIMEDIENGYILKEKK